MLSGRVPFQSSTRDRSAESIMRRIKGGEFSLKARQFESVSSEAKELIKGLLTVDPSKRLTMDELRQHKWIQDNHTEVSSFSGASL